MSSPIVRTKIMQIRVSEVEFEMIHSRASQAGLSCSELFRRNALLRPLPKRTTKIAVQTYVELGKIGNNINQLTKAANTAIALGQKPRELAAEFKFSRQLNPNVERAVYHVSLSLAPGEYLSDEEWNEISDRYLREMNFHNNQYVVYRHGDKENDHIHIVASRISLDDGRCVHDGWDYKRSEAIVRQLERDYNLESVRGSHEKLERTATTGQHRRIEREQGEYDLGLRDNPPELPVKMQLQEIIDGLCPVCDHRVTALKEDGSTDNYLTMPRLIERLQGEGVEVRHGFTRNGKSKGISYSFLGQAFSGSHLGAAYTFPGLQKHKGVSYQAQRDDMAIKQLLLNPVNYGVATGFEQSDGLTHDGITGSTDKEDTIDVTDAYANYCVADANTLDGEKDGAVEQNEQWQVIYQQICLKVTPFVNDDERDYIIVKRLLQLERPLSEIREIINASPIEYTLSTVKELMVRANLELLSEHQKQRSQHKKQSKLEL
ncbi:relaxase/mobilization nuclease domain-containing protein [Calothrix sp. PCC 6303]|uniref:relaxase/mobilization nuclease domain-containing protein n=1 Tax=Calothrix sp. PCC 6303 TaxID=1170562 RepID=UPI0002A028EA|nr:relaxase/mobilization nuclease domain-containing protein [Calothrix sp. PCC 6303]AFZ04598.1 Relaxase/mobilization nuclease family protein [Calothrix sp. PCC 6303]